MTPQRASDAYTSQVDREVNLAKVLFEMAAEAFCYLRMTHRVPMNHLAMR